MRPIVDTDNLWYSEETLVYRSRGRLLFKFVVLFCMAFAFFYLFGVENGYLGSIFLLILSAFIIRNIIRSITKMDEIELRINSEGIQIKEEPIITWDKIGNERILTIKAGKSSYVHDFLFYDRNQHKEMKFRVENFNIDQQELLKSCEIHRKRFNILKNPQTNITAL